MTLPKCVSAKLLPTEKLRLEFENGAIRYFPLDFDVTLYLPDEIRAIFERRYQGDLFDGDSFYHYKRLGVYFCDGYPMENGDVRFRREIIPLEMLWACSVEHVWQELPA